MLNPLAALVQQFRHAVIDPSAPSTVDVLGSYALLMIPVALAVGPDRARLRHLPARRADDGRATLRRAERAHVQHRVAHKRRIDARGAQPLRLGPAADPDAAEGADVAPHLEQRDEQILEVLDLEIVDARLEAVRRAQRLRDDDQPRGAAHRDAVLERRIRLVVEVQPDVDLAQVLEQPVVGHPVRDVDDVVLVLGRAEEVLAVLRSSGRRRASVGGSAAHVRPEEQPVGDRQRERPPDGQDPARRSRRSAGRTRRSGRSWPGRRPADRRAGARGRGGRRRPPRGIGSVRKPIVSAPRSAKTPAGMISGRKTSTTSGSNARTAASIALGVGAGAELDEERLDAGRRLLQRAGGEVRRLPDERQPQRRPVGVGERVRRRSGRCSLRRRGRRTRA